MDVEGVMGRRDRKGRMSEEMVLTETDMVPLKQGYGAIRKDN